jgi:hypothetical protein
MIQEITFGVALLGAVLGVVNTWHAIDRSRVKLKVRPAHAIAVGGIRTDLSFCIEVTNLSAFAVTVGEVGFLYRGTDRRSCIAQPVVIDGGSWPRRLEARSSVTLYSQRPPASIDGGRMKCAYATTHCGYTARGTSGAMKQISQAG